MAAPDAHSHAPSLQLCPSLQRVSHSPQCAGSLAVLMQPSAHRLCSALGQPQSPKLHVWPTSHATAQSPQCCSSRIGSTQSSPHCRVPRGHDMLRPASPIPTSPSPSLGPASFWVPDACPASSERVSRSSVIPMPPFGGRPGRSGASSRPRPGSRSEAPLAPELPAAPKFGLVRTLAGPHGRLKHERGAVRLHAGSNARNNRASQSENAARNRGLGRSLRASRVCLCCPVASAMTRC